MTPETADDLYFASLRRQVRLVVLLHAAEEAGLVPLPLLRLHTFAFLSNVLAPVWELPPLDGRLLRRRGGPFYPTLQEDIDRLVGMGLARIRDLGHVQSDDGQWRLEGRYQLHRSFAQAALTFIDQIEAERRVLSFVQELALALSSLSDAELDEAMKQDATYADPAIDFGNVIDFAEWQHENSSVNATIVFESALPNRIVATAGEKLHLYVRHLHDRLAQVAAL